MKSERRIDRIRNSAGSMVIGSKDEGEITSIISTEDLLYCVKANAVYAIQMADQIDPERTNEKIPNVQQKILSDGSENSAVVQVLLTADRLMRPEYLDGELDRNKCIRLALDVARDFLELEAARKAFDEKIAKLQSNTLQGLLPAAGDADHRFDAFTQKSSHIVKTLREMTEFMMGKSLGRKWVDGLLTLSSKSTDDHPLHRFIEWARPHLLWVIETRNLVEHPGEKAHIAIHDFRLSPSGRLIPPTAEIVSELLRDQSIAVATFFNDTYEGLLPIAEGFIVELCARRLKRAGPGGLEVQIQEVPADPAHRQSRYGYAVKLPSGEVLPIG